LRPVAKPFCNVCGLPLSTFDDLATATCGRCLTKPPPYDMARYGYYYERSVRAGITRLKFHSSLFNIRSIGELLVAAFNTHYSTARFDCIIPVPVHRKRLIGRGFNQVVCLSKRLSQATGIFLDRTALVKCRQTDPQVGLPRSKRLVNLKNAFGVNHPERISGKRVLIIDDVSTTGTTVSEVARTLQKAGAAYVAILVVGLRSRNRPDELDF
ncbi:MAG: ComF family protein, partial [Desulfomonilaceae bacterium]